MVLNVLGATFYYSHQSLLWPGETQFPDSTYAAAISKLKSHSNVKVLGYTHVQWASRSISDVITGIDKYAGWSAFTDLDIALSGIFLDEAPSEVGSNSANLQYMKDLQIHIRQALGSSAFTMTNPGTIIDKAFYQYAGAIVSYENHLEHYYDPGTLQNSQDTSRSPGTPTSQQGIIVTSVTGSQAREKYLLGKIVSRGVGYVYFTRDADYLAFGSDLALMVEEIANKNGLLKKRSLREVVW
ncbi:Spherulin-4 [Dactylella cylindrospora]|nr:Spherulin-4 [Dactylella cylindrospora]